MYDLFQVDTAYLYRIYLCNVSIQDTLGNGNINTKTLKTCVCPWKCFLMVKKDPFGVCNDSYTSAAFG